MRFLPNETWSDVLRFVPFRPLHLTFSVLSRRFSALAQPFLGELCPRKVGHLIIKWDSKLCSHYLEQLEIDKTPKVRGSSEKWPKIVARHLPFPSTPPPANIIGFREIRIEGHFGPQVLDLLSQCRAKIPCCYVIFEDFGNFINTPDGVRLHQFIEVLGMNCTTMRLNWDNSGQSAKSAIPPELFDSPTQMPNCAFFDFDQISAPFDASILTKWLIGPMANGFCKGLALRISSGCNDEEREETTESIRTTVNMLREERENIGAIIVMLSEVQLGMEPFREGQLQLRRQTDRDWTLINSGVMGQVEGEEETKVAIAKSGRPIDRSGGTMSGHCTKPVLTE